MTQEFVVDNSVVMSWCFKDEISKYADAVLDCLAVATAYVPAVWPLEVGNVLLVAERRNRLSQADSSRFITLLLELPIIVEQESPERILGEILALAREYKLSSYDATYLDLAMRKGLPLASLDKNLMLAAKKCRVPILNIKEII